MVQPFPQWYNKLVMNQTKIQPPIQIFFSVFKQATATVSKHFYLVLLPLGLDIFLLLGPKLGLSKLITPLLKSLPAIDNFEQQFSLTWNEFITSTIELVEQLNLFGSLRSLPFGVPSMMSARLGTVHPFGVSIANELDSFGTAFIAFLLLSAIGTLLGTLYFTLAHKAVQLDSAGTPTNSNVFSSFINLVGLNLITWFLILLVMLPFVFVLGLLLNLSPMVGYLVYVLAVVIVLSLVMPLIFTPNYMVIDQINFFKAAKKSVKLSRSSGLLASLFILTCILISYLTNYLWNSAPNSSPFVLIGLFGHALITSILLTASFHFVQWRDKENVVQPQATII